MEKIRLHYLAGDVHMGGHDAPGGKNNHAAAGGRRRFEVTVVCDGPGLGIWALTNILTGGC